MSQHSSDVWNFNPALAPAVVATALYGIVTILLIGRIVQFKSFFMTVIAVGTTMEVLGFGARSAGVEKKSNLQLYEMQLACTILAPIFTAAAEYIVLGRIMAYVGRRFSLIRPGLVAWIFIISDIVSFFIQVAGAGVLMARPVSTDTDAADVAHSEKVINMGDNILLGGLAVNLVSFVIFSVQVIYFDYRTRKENAAVGKWRTLLHALYVSTFFVLIRQIYRVIEFSEGWSGYLPTHEVYFLIFDSLMILIASSVFVWYWPSKYIPDDPQMRLAEDGTEYREMTVKEKARMDGSEATLSNNAPTGEKLA